MNILITGASQGLGLELAKSALKRGYRVFAVARHVSPELGELQGENCSIHISIFPCFFSGKTAGN